MSWRWRRWSFLVYVELVNSQRVVEPVRARRHQILFAFSVVSSIDLACESTWPAASRLLHPSFFARKCATISSGDIPKTAALRAASVVALLRPSPVSFRLSVKPVCCTTSSVALIDFATAAFNRKEVSDCCKLCLRLSVLVCLGPADDLVEIFPEDRTLRCDMPPCSQWLWCVESPTPLAIV
ncbi:hypothetical protein CCR75_007712 [Bremia lactucae]|uniref:Secreted protein n=1 Tax=Bremia lactucae TaxID=4779 RepID=A0A976FLV4_BRELC|nr:hypothetical protein CCR75_007712 [Bremia lactucae]